MRIPNRNSANPKIRELARQLLAHESAARSFSDENMPAVLGVSEKLRLPLSVLTGPLGFRALLSRALTLAQMQAPELRALQVRPDGSLEGAEAFSGGSFHDPLWQDPFTEAVVTLISQLLELLIVFIGEGMTLNLVCYTWPDLPVAQTELWRNNKS